MTQSLDPRDASMSGRLNSSTVYLSERLISSVTLQPQALAQTDITGAGICVGVLLCVYLTETKKTNLKLA